MAMRHYDYGPGYSPIQEGIVVGVNQEHVNRVDGEAAAAPPLPEWLTVEEYAKHMRIGRALAYRMAADGRVPIRRIGKIIRVHRSAAIES